MSHRCFDPDELAALGDLPHDDPRRREAAACPRCDSLLAAMAAFLAGDDDVPVAELAAADRRLSAFVAGRLTSAPAAAAGRPGHAAGRTGGLRRHLASPRWRVGTALVAVAAAVLLMIGRIPSAPTGPSGTVRGGPAPAPAAVVGEAVVTPAADGSGGLQLAWPAVPGADHYEIILITAALDTLAVVGPLAEPAARVDGRLLRSAGPDGVFCRIRAFTGRTPLAASRLQELPPP